jgi:homoserine kinase
MGRLLADPSSGNYWGAALDAVCDEPENARLRRSPTAMTFPPALMRPIRVSVPASTSNLGPGFDFLGLALSLFLDVRVSGPSSGERHEFASLAGTAEGWPRGPENLVFRAFELAAGHLGLQTGALRFEARSDIPVARGLGSSGAAVAAGLLLASAMAARPAEVHDLLAWGLEIEGHPDNSSAALLGGCTLSVPRPSGGLCVVQQPLHPDLAFALAWPSRVLPTKTARAALPAQVQFADAVENPRRLALLLEGLRRADPELLALGGEDRLHVRYRLPLIDGGAAAIEAARAGGAWLATISGSGSALIAIGPRTRIDGIAAEMEKALRAGDPRAESRVVAPVLGAPVVT